MHTNAFVQFFHSIRIQIHLNIPQHVQCSRRLRRLHFYNGINSHQPSSQLLLFSYSKFVRKNYKFWFSIVGFHERCLKNAIVVLVA